MYLRDPNAPPPPRVTCPDCGLEYVDDSDWSGSAHGERHCREHLQKRLAEVIAERDEALKGDAELAEQLDLNAKALAVALKQRDDGLAKLKEIGALQGHNEPCYYCKKPCNAVAGSPTLWPIPLCHADEPGRVKWHHIGCVDERLNERDTWLAAAFEIACDSPELLVERVKRLVKERNEARQRAADEVELADCLRRERDKAVSALKASTEATETLHGQLGVMDERRELQRIRAEEAEKRCAELLREVRVR